MTGQASSATEAEVLLAAGGDREAFARLVNATRSLVSSIALAELRDLEAARDVAQDVYLQVWNDLGAIRNPRSFLPFLRQVTRQRARRVAERRAREVRGPGAKASLDAAVDPAEDASGRLLRTERIDVVRQALDALPDDAREIVALYYLEGHSASQVARLLGLREEAVHQRLSRARARLRAGVLERLGGALESAAPGAAFTAAVLASLPSSASALGAASGLGAAASTLGGKATLAGAIVAVLAILAVLSTSSGGGGGAGKPGGEGTVSIARPRPSPTREEPSPPPSPDALPAEGSLEVRVLVPDAPAAGAEIRVYRRVPVDPESALPGWQVVRSLHAGPEGRAAVSAPPGAYLVTARVPGFAAGQVEVVRPSGEPVTSVEIAVSREASLTGRVVSRSPVKPVPLATLSLERESSLGSSSTGLPLEERFGTVADGQGRFSLGGLAPGSYRLVAEAPGHARTTLRQVAVPRQSTLEVLLGSAGVIEGSVVLADGRPAAGAEVLLTGGPELLTVTTGARGGFAAEVQPGSYRVSAVLGRAAGAIVEPVPVAAGATVEGVEIRLAAAAAVVGRVADAKGAPISGAQVMLSPVRESGEVARALTSTTGAFEVGPITPAEYDLEVVAAGHSPAERGGLVVLPGQRFEIDLQLQGVGSVEGTVRGEEGEPVAGARVRGGRMWGGALGSVPAEAIAGPDGRYLLPALEVGVADVRATRPGAGRGSPKAVQVEAGRRSVADFVLPATGIVEGQVRFAGSWPPDANVAVFAMPDQVSLHARDFGRVATSQDGRFRVELPAGAFRFRASTAERTAASERIPVKVHPGETTRIELLLKPVDEDPRRLVIEVREPGGAPAGGATIVLAGDGYRFGNVADDTGRAEISRPPIPMVLEARKGGRIAKPVTVAADARTAEAELQPAARVRGRVLAPGGAQIPGFTLTLETPAAHGVSFGKGEQRLFTGDRFELSNVPSGPVRLLATTRDGQAGEVSLTLAPGEAAERDVTVQAAGRILVRPVDGQGRPAQGAYVTLGSRMVDTASDGLYFDPEATRGGVIVVEEVPAGRHEIRVGARQHVEVVRLVDVEAGQSVDLGSVVIGPAPGR